MQITPQLRMQFQQYVDDVPKARGLLEFLLDNLELNIKLDFGRASLVDLERAFWEVRAKGLPAELSDERHFLTLMTQYLADSIIRATNAKWVQSTERNPTFGQPALDGFGNETWDRIYPVALASHFVDLAKTNPNIAGVSDRTVLASRYDKALSIHERA